MMAVHAIDNAVARRSGYPPLLAPRRRISLELWVDSRVSGGFNAGSSGRRVRWLSPILAVQSYDYFQY